jgi:hypothetical protein
MEGYVVVFRLEDDLIKMTGFHQFTDKTYKKRIL